jgi:RNA polymerase sigma-70 factor (ECF subfamily)
MIEMECLSDIELVRRAVHGDPDAFESLVNRHYTLVYRVAYKWRGKREDAEDITQEVFIKLARAIYGFKGDASFTTWLYRITVNTARDLLKSESVKRTHEEAYAVELGTERQGGQRGRGGHGNPVGPEQLYRALDKLPVKLKEAVLLVLAEGLTHKEAAFVLGCAEATVSWRLFQARKKLVKLLKKEAQ